MNILPCPSAETPSYLRLDYTSHFLLPRCDADAVNTIILVALLMRNTCTLILARTRPIVAKALVQRRCFAKDGTSPRSLRSIRMWDTADAHLHRLSTSFLTDVFKKVSFQDMKVTPRKPLIARFRCVQLFLFEVGSDLNFQLKCATFSSLQVIFCLASNRSYL